MLLRHSEDLQLWASPLGYGQNSFADRSILSSGSVDYLDQGVDYLVYQMQNPWALPHPHQMKMYICKGLAMPSLPGLQLFSAFIWKHLWQLVNSFLWSRCTHAPSQCWGNCWGLTLSLPKIMTLWSASHCIPAMAGKDILMEGSSLGVGGTSYYGNVLLGIRRWMASHFN